MNHAPAAAPAGTDAASTFPPETVGFSANHQFIVTSRPVDPTGATVTTLRHDNTFVYELRVLNAKDLSPLSKDAKIDTSDVANDGYYKLPHNPAHRPSPVTFLRPTKPAAEPAAADSTDASTQADKADKADNVDNPQYFYGSMKIKGSGTYEIHLKIIDGNNSDEHVFHATID